MATRTISDAGGNWGDTSAWVEGAVPTSADEVVATVTSGNLTINFGALVQCRSINLTGYTGTLTHDSGVFLDIGDATAPTGNDALIFPSSGWTYTLGSATLSRIRFFSTSATQLNVNPGGKTFADTQFSAAGSWKLTGDLLTGSTATVTHMDGSFDANGFNVTCGLFSGSATTVRALIMGSGTWTITGSGGTVWSMANVTNLTLTRGNPVILNYSGSTGTRTISSGSTGGTESTAIDFTVTAGSDTVSTSSARMRSLTFNGFTGTWTKGTNATIYGDLTIASGSSGMSTTAAGTALTFGATSGTKTITTNGVTLDFPMTANGVGGTFQLADHLTLGSTRTLTITNGTFDANNKNVSVGAVSSSNSNARSILMGSGTWTITGTGTIWTTATATNLTLNVGTASVVLTGATGTIAGSTTFYNLTKAVVSASSLTFTDGTTNGASNSLALTGSAGQLLTLQGSSTGGWTLAVPSTQSLGYLSVSRSTATGNTALAGSTSTDGGNNVNWTFGGAVGTRPSNLVPASVTPSSGTPATSFAFNAGTWSGTAGYPITYTWVYRKSGSQTWLSLSTSQNPIISGTVFPTPATYDTQVTATNTFGSTTINGPSVNIGTTKPSAVNPLGYFGL